MPSILHHHTHSFISFFFLNKQTFIATVPLNLGQFTNFVECVIVRLLQMSGCLPKALNSKHSLQCIMFVRKSIEKCIRNELNLV